MMSKFWDGVVGVLVVLCFMLVCVMSYLVWGNGKATAVRANDNAVSDTVEAEEPEEYGSGIVSESLSNTQYLWRMTDKRTGVVCYANRSGISCVKL